MWCNASAFCWQAKWLVLVLVLLVLLMVVVVVLLLVAAVVAVAGPRLGGRVPRSRAAPSSWSSSCVLLAVLRPPAAQLRVRAAPLWA